MLELLKERNLTKHIPKTERLHTREQNHIALICFQQSVR